MFFLSISTGLSTLQLGPNQDCMCTLCINIGTGLFPSAGTPSQERGSCYQMVKQTYHPTAHNSNPLSTLLSTCLLLFYYLHSLCLMRRKETRRAGGRKNSMEIMRISKKFQAGVFYFNHQDYPSSVALISPLLSLYPLPLS